MDPFRQLYTARNPLSNTIVNSESISLKPGVVLIREGDKGDCAYLLVKGKLSVVKEVHGERIMIGEILPVELVGELAILNDAPRSATVMAEEHSEVVKINPHRLKSLIRRSPEIAEIVIKILCRRLQDNSRKLTEILSRVRAFSGKKAVKRSNKRIMDRPLDESNKPLSDADKAKRQRMAIMERKKS